MVLCGDSAHVFPPCKPYSLLIVSGRTDTCTVGGQGIASGFRDSISLAWRLALLCRYQSPGSDSHKTVLTAWYQERKQQLDQSLATTIRNGQFVTENNAFKIFQRSWYLWLVQLVPSWKRDLQQGPRIEGPVRYSYLTGMPFVPDLNGGLNVPQVYCRDISGKVYFTDDVIFRQPAAGIFRMFVYLNNNSDIPAASEILKKVEKWSHGELIANNTPFLVEHVDHEKVAIAKDHTVYQLATGEEFAKSPLCIRRPDPVLYDKYQIRDKIRGKFVIVRPDRFIFAACSEEDELKRAIESMLIVLQI